MATRLPDASQQAAADAVVDRIDVGVGTAAGVLRIYSGAQPADADSAPVGTLLVSIPLAAPPAYGAAATTGTAALLGTPRSASASAAGTAASFRVVNRDGATVFDGSVTATGGGGDLTLDNTSIASGQTVNINSLNYTHPAG